MSSNWTSEKVCYFLQKNTHLPQTIINIFSQEAIDGSVFLELTKNDLEELGISRFGHKKQVLKAILEAKSYSVSPKTRSKTVIDSSIPTSSRKRSNTSFSRPSPESLHLAPTSSSPPILKERPHRTVKQPPTSKKKKLPPKAFRERIVKTKSPKPPKSPKLQKSHISPKPKPKLYVNSQNHQPLLSNSTEYPLHRNASSPSLPRESIPIQRKKSSPLISSSRTKKIKRSSPSSSPRSSPKPLQILEPPPGIPEDRLEFDGNDFVGYYGITGNYFELEKRNSLWTYIGFIDNWGDGTYKTFEESGYPSDWEGPGKLPCFPTPLPISNRSFGHRKRPSAPVLKRRQAPSPKSNVKRSSPDEIGIEPLHFQLWDEESHPLFV